MALQCEKVVVDMLSCKILINISSSISWYNIGILDYSFWRADELLNYSFLLLQN